MKKYLTIIVIFLFAFVITACGSSSVDKKIDELLDTYLEGFRNGDVDKMFSSYPDFAKEYYKKYVTKEKIVALLEEYGDNVQTSYKITDREKITEDELKILNDKIKTAFENNDFVSPSECYKIKGTTTIKGSKEEKTNDINDLWICKFDGSWKLIGY